MLTYFEWDASQTGIVLAKIGHDDDGPTFSAVQHPWPDGADAAPGFADESDVAGNLMRAQTYADRLGLPLRVLVDPSGWRDEWGELIRTG